MKGSLVRKERETAVGLIHEIGCKEELEWVMKVSKEELEWVMKALNGSGRQWEITVCKATGFVLGWEVLKTIATSKASKEELEWVMLMKALNGSGHLDDESLQGGHIKVENNMESTSKARAWLLTGPTDWPESFEESNFKENHNKTNGKGHMRNVSKVRPVGRIKATSVA
ncbi:hypothetical protein L1987_46473 [Smallanthus sonchifolius]|uniref:Uncharacterized protein n=1 Tax=Smallanthus sonchifolius TaxID=185202 RepID=A0ACB9FZY5_9ASTR|nr:hypothetical protein L1987_46473 [Smallanthus sonchifolius]